MKTREKNVKEVKKASYPNDTLRTIYERRAVRKFKDKTVSKALLAQVLEAGRMAPSAINKQPWQFYVITKKDVIQKYAKEIAKAAAKSVLKSGLRNILKTSREFLHFTHGTGFLKADDPVFHGAPVVIFICSPKNNEWASLDIGMCAQNIMLAAKSLGLDSCPVGFGKFVEQTKSYKKLEIPDAYQVNLAVVLGYGDELPEPKVRVANNVFEPEIIF